MLGVFGGFVSQLHVVFAFRLQTFSHDVVFVGDAIVVAASLALNVSESVYRAHFMMWTESVYGATT